MCPEEVFRRVGALRYMKLAEARVFYDLIVTNRLHSCLELGFLHGVSTAYIAGAVQDLGSGQVTTIDRITAVALDPNIDWVLSITGLRDWVQVYLEPTSFNWRLMKFLEEGRFETFDFCYLDGGHSWYESGMAFCLIERLLKPGGWVVLDDLHFTFRQSSNRHRSWVQRMPEEEQITPQIERVFELLVESNPYFDCFRRMGRFGFARKKEAVWSKEKRDGNRVHLIVASALERARTDPEFRAALLLFPAKTLSNFSALPEHEFAHLSFAESGCRAPIPSEVSGYGSAIVYVEQPAQERPLSKKKLKRLLQVE